MNGNNEGRLVMFCFLKVESKKSRKDSMKEKKTEEKTPKEEEKEKDKENPAGKNLVLSLLFLIKSQLNQRS